jgi:hypothetical protein
MDKGKMANDQSQKGRGSERGKGESEGLGEWAGPGFRHVVVCMTDAATGVSSSFE